VHGIYSDLLVHDMGSQLSDPVPGPFDPTATELRPVSGYYGALSLVPAPISLEARRREWKTPPLWGLRDSAPYLHDGRAETIDLAIALHGGEAADSLQRYRALSPRGRGQLLAFLSTLAAPRDPPAPLVARPASAPAKSRKGLALNLPR
jgi:CxxC motif-containing protein (DUF1111 family)